MKELYHKNESIIDSILFILNEYTESHRAVKYHHGISHLEELLYFVEIFLQGFTYSQTFYLFRILIKLSTCKEWENEEIEHYDLRKQQKIIKAYILNKFRSHFVVYSENPIKICMYFITIVIKMAERFPSLTIGSNFICGRYVKLCSEIIINSQDIEQVQHQLNGRPLRR